MNKATPERWQQFHTAVGKVTREWANLETILSLAFTALLRTDEFRARIVWGSMTNFRARRNLLALLASTYLNEPLEVEFAGLLKRAKRLAELRNMLAHNNGGVDHETGQPFFMRDQPDDQNGFNFLATRHLSMTNIENLSGDISRLSRDVGAILNRLSGEAHASPKMHRGRLDDPTP